MQQSPGEGTGSETQRAEELVDQMGQVAGRWASAAGLWLVRGAARAREEVDDMWAEAQSMRRPDEPRSPQV